MYIEKILVVDDDFSIQNLLSQGLKKLGYEVDCTTSAIDALNLMREKHFDLVLADSNLHHMSGLEFLKKIRETHSSSIVIIMSEHGSVEHAVEAMRLGAFYYLTKPFSLDTIQATLQKAKEHHVLIEENRYLREQINHHRGCHESIVGQSSVMKKVLAEVYQIAQSHASVFITGESGTGKEVIAHAIHNNSPRHAKPFIRVNCAAIPDTLIESEFFGHEKGAYTGAAGKRIGRFELANSGTLLLDEVTEIPANLQSKLLRVVQEQEFERVGGALPVKVDVRLISTSNRNLKEAIEKKIIREDLFYRLNVIPIHLPPLRDRREDIIPLSEYFLKRICIENHQPLKELSLEAKAKLLSYSWPGNIRELTNIIERAVVLNTSKSIDAHHLFLEGYSAKQEIIVPSKNHLVFPLGTTLDELEKKLIIETLNAQNNNRTRTAEILGISIRTLRNKLHEYRLVNESQNDAK